MGYRIGIIGPESTGKSTLASYLAKRYDGVLVEEYARTYVEDLMAKGERKEANAITYEDVCTIARHQIEEIERLAVSGERLAVYDTELIVTKVWFDYTFGQVPDWLEEAIRTYPMDVYLLMKPDIPWVPDSARSNGSDEIRSELFDRYEREIQATGIPYYIIAHA